MQNSSGPSLREVAAEAGVSAATASYVLNGRAEGRRKYSDETQARVLEAARKLGYTPNFAARGLRRGRTDQIALITRGPGSPFTLQLGEDVSEVMEHHGYSTILFFRGDWMAFLRKRGIDGAIIDLFGNRSVDPAELATLAEQGLGLVVMSNELEPAGFDVVSTTESAACMGAMRYLIGRGHRRIACLRRDPEEGVGYVPERYLNYENALAEAGIPVDPGLVRYTGGSVEVAYTEAIALLEAPDRPTAIFALTSAAGVAAIWAATRLGLRIPEDVAVIGVGPTRDGEHVGLTAVSPVERHQAAVADLLLTRISGKAPAEGRVLRQEWALLYRSSA